MPGTGAVLPTETQQSSYRKRRLGVFPKAATVYNLHSCETTELHLTAQRWNSQALHNGILLQESSGRVWAHFSQTRINTSNKKKNTTLSTNSLVNLFFLNLYFPWEAHFVLVFLVDVIWTFSSSFSTIFWHHVFIKIDNYDCEVTT